MRLGRDSGLRNSHLVPYFTTRLRQWLQGMPSTATTSMPSSPESPSTSYAPTRRRRCKGRQRMRLGRGSGACQLTLGVLWPPGTRPGPRGGGGGGGAPAAELMLKMVRLGRESGRSWRSGGEVRKELRSLDGALVVRHGPHSGQNCAKTNNGARTPWRSLRPRRARQPHTAPHSRPRTQPQPQPGEFGPARHSPPRAGGYVMGSDLV